MTISSSTVDVNTLKEIREYASVWEGGAITRFRSSLNIEMERMEVRDANNP